MRFTKHIPNCVDTSDENLPIEFSTLEELLQIPFVKKFADDGTFYRYSMNEEHLMAEYNNGYEWWTIGKLEGVPTPLLPQAEFKYTEEDIQRKKEQAEASKQYWTEWFKKYARPHN